MERRSLEEVVNNIDARLARVEQILPTLVTKEELREELRGLATKDDLKQLATKDELKKLATKDELKKLATKEELKKLATKAEVKAEIMEEGRRTRRHFDVVAERLEGHIRLLAEGQEALREQMDRRFDDVTAQLKQHDRRITRIEARPS
jgi:hypothetical protein